MIIEQQLLMHNVASAVAFLRLFPKQKHRIIQCMNQSMRTKLIYYYQEEPFMKKLFILVLVLLMEIIGTSSAAKSRFKDPNYNFGNIMNVYLAECTYAPKTNQPHDLQEDSNPTGRALNSLRTAMAKKNKNLIVPPDEPTRARLDLHLAVHTLATYTYWKEPWIEEVYENKKITERDRDGR